MGLVEFHQLIQVHGAHAVAVGQHEGLVPDVGLNPLYTPAGHGVEPGVHQGHLPGLGIVVVHFHLVVGQVKGHVGGVQEIIREKLLHHILLVTQADHEVMEPVLRVILHNMPHDGPAADLDHGLRL